MDERKTLERELAELFGDKLVTEDHLAWLDLKIAELQAQLRELDSLGVS